MNTIDRIAYSNALARRSAAEKMILALGMLLAALVLPPWPGGPVVLTVMLIATLGVAKVPARTYFRIAWAPLSFLSVGVIPLLVSIGFRGSWLVSFHWAEGGVGLVIRVSLRSFAALSCLLFLSMTTPIPQVLRVMRRLHVPPVLTEVSLVIYRNIWMFVATVRSIRRAQHARLGYSSLRTSYRSLGMLVGTFFGQTLQRARAMEHGLQARNWQGELVVLDEGTAATARGVTLVTGVLVLALALSLGAKWAM
ncbi:MAG: cobalt ECF transporter T component CbiQ [Actinobacteria bacterium]|nr:cobalt ECF transporter T component CbiQ [Actinomycetota bacterium]